MPIEHEKKIRTKDGHEAGHVKHAIWDASGRKITEYVIATGGVLGHDVIVSPELLDGAPRKGDEIVLSIDKHELSELAHYESDDYAPPPPQWAAPTVSGFPAGGHLFPVTEREIAPIAESSRPTDEAGRESEVASREPRK